MRAMTKAFIGLSAAGLIGVPVLAAGSASALGAAPVPEISTWATEGPGLCNGTIVGNVDQDSASEIHLTSHFSGLGTCATTAYVHWTNKDTGAAGDVGVKLVGSWYNSARIPSGRGHIQLTVTTHELVHSNPVTVDYLMPS